MEKDFIIAKNLLENKTCKNCEYSFGESCKYYDDIDGPISIASLPEDNTCSKWKEKHNKVLNIEWSKDAEVDISTYRGIDTEEELIKSVLEEINNEITVSIMNKNVGE